MAKPMPYLSRRSVWWLTLSLSILVCLAAAVAAGAREARLADFRPATAQPARFTLFESGQVRPLALSPTGKLLFAANTPDNRLEVFRIVGNGLQHRASISVGLEPVAVAARSDNEVWVINHLSDSVSVVVGASTSLRPRPADSCPARPASSRNGRSKTSSSPSTATWPPSWDNRRR